MDNKVTIRDANVITRNSNFSGVPKNEFDKKGDRYVFIRLDEDLANKLEQDGWNVKWTKPKIDHPEWEPYPFIKAKINFNLRQKPAIYMVTKRNRTLLNEETIDQLEGCYFEKVDITLENIFYTRYNQHSVIVNIGFFTIEPNELYDEYFGGSDDQIFDDEDDIPFN